MGADDPPFRPVMGKRGGAGTVAGVSTRGADACSSATMAVAASASRDTESLRQGREGAGRGIAEGAQRREQHRQQDMDPLIGFALDHAE